MKAKGLLRNPNWTNKTIYRIDILMWKISICSETGH